MCIVAWTRAIGSLCSTSLTFLVPICVLNLLAINAWLSPTELLNTLYVDTSVGTTTRIELS